MANVSAPFGFWQRGGLGSAPTYEQFENGNGGIDYNAGAIYYGDPVLRAGSGDGTLVQGSNAQTVPMAGVFIGCKYLSTSQKRQSGQTTGPVPMSLRRTNLRLVRGWSTILLHSSWSNRTRRVLCRRMSARTTIIRSARAPQRMVCRARIWSTEERQRVPNLGASSPSYSIHLELQAQQLAGTTMWWLPSTTSRPSL